MASLSIIVASSGRETLERTLESARSQMCDGDELLVAIQTDCPWGHKARNQLMRCARGDALCFMDDDDAYTPGALDTIRAAFEAEPSRMHLFRMRYAHGDELWREQDVRCGNVSTQMVVVPRERVTGAARAWTMRAQDWKIEMLGPPQWGDRYEGDYDFIAASHQLLGDPVWHEEAIALVRPT